MRNIYLITVLLALSAPFANAQYYTQQFDSQITSFNAWPAGNTSHSDAVWPVYGNQPSIPYYSDTHYELVPPQYYTPCRFYRNLGPGSLGEDVRCLQRYLNASGFFINFPGKAGSPGFETNYYGARTREAAARWEQANEIFPDGYFGPVSRAAYLALEGQNYQSYLPVSVPVPY